MTDNRSVQVQFNDPGEFIKELQLNRTHIRLPVLRTTQQFMQSSQLPISHVSVRAGYLFDRAGFLHLVCLDCACGDVMTSEPYAKSATAKRATAILDQLAAAAAELELEVRAGEFKLTAP